MKKSQKGFTLVELIVVIAIIGVLAAILVPSMMGYVKKSKLKSANSNAKLVYTTANSALADCVVEGKVPSTGSFKADTSAAFSGWSKSITDSSSADDILMNSVYQALKDNGKGIGVVWIQLRGTGTPAKYSEVQLAQWADTKDSVIVGQYPNPENNPDDTNTFGRSIT